MERDALNQAKQSFFNRRHSLRKIKSDDCEPGFRLQSYDLTPDEQEHIAEYLRREGFDAKVVTGETYHNSFVQVAEAQGDELHAFVAQLDKKRYTDLLQIGHWLVSKEGWVPAHSAEHGKVMRFDEHSLEPEQREGLIAFLNHHGIETTRIVSKSFGTRYIQIAAHAVAEFNKLRATLEQIMPSKHSANANQKVSA